MTEYEIHFKDGGTAFLDISPELGAYIDFGDKTTWHKVKGYRRITGGIGPIGYLIKDRELINDSCMTYETDNGEEETGEIEKYFIIPEIDCE